MIFKKIFAIFLVLGYREPSLQSVGFSRYSMKAQLPLEREILVPQPGIEPVCLVLEGKVLTTAPPGKSPQGASCARKLQSISCASPLLHPTTALTGHFTHSTHGHQRYGGQARGHHLSYDLTLFWHHLSADSVVCRRWGLSLSHFSQQVYNYVMPTVSFFSRKCLKMMSLRGN